MSATSRDATTDVLDCLRTVSHEALRPAGAQRRLRAVQAQHPDLEMELVWDEESYDGSLHYDVLVRAPGHETLSLSLCRDGALPWPLRGVRRWSDADLAQVNGKILKMQDAIGFLDVLWNEAPIMERILDVCLLREELARRPVELSDGELQRGMDNLRRAHRLLDTDATHRWMQQRGLTHEQLEQLVADNLTLDLLRERIAEGRVERYFEEHGADFDTAQVARLEFADEASALEVHRRIVTAELELFAAAQQQFLAAPRTKAKTEPARTLFTTLIRRDVTGELAAIFEAAPGALLGPARVGEQHVIVKLLARTAAQLDEPTRAAIKEILLEEWLAERRRAANITWFWGTADRTPQAA